MPRYSLVHYCMTLAWHKTFKQLFREGANQVQGKLYTDAKTMFYWC